MTVPDPVRQLTGRLILLIAAAAGLACCGAIALGQQTEKPATATQTLEVPHEPITPPGPGETLESALTQIRSRLASIRTVKAEVELSKKDKKKRKVKTGPMEVARQQGARIALTRKGETEEYIATPSLLWSYEHKEREAQYIPTGLPVISTFVRSALALDMLLALDGDTMKLKGTSSFEGEPCWVIEGKSPDTLKIVGVPVVKMRVWVSKKDGLPRRISLPKEKDTLILLRQIQVNAAIDAGRFQWAPPKGVRTKNLFGF